MVAAAAGQGDGGGDAENLPRFSMSGRGKHSEAARRCKNMADYVVWGLCEVLGVRGGRNCSAEQKALQVWRQCLHLCRAGME